MKIREQLQSNLLFKIGEILLVFISAFSFIKLVLPFAEDNPVLKQAVIWTANIIMLVLVWIGIKIREEDWSAFGLQINLPSLKKVIKMFLQSILVFVLAMLGFIIGSIIMANITGIPESSDMTNYAYLKDNFPMLLLTLSGVYIVSSFGEEVIYRAFLINRLSEMGLNSKWGTVITVILSSAIFGFVHYEWGPMGIVQTAFMGLALAICYIKLKKNLWVLILAHAYMDTILMLQMYMANN